LGLKTVSSSLMIWVSKSPRWFVGLSLKTKILFFWVLCVTSGADLRAVVVWASEFGSHFLHSPTGSDFDCGLHGS
jgi:hypothetical protein